MAQIDLKNARLYVRDGTKIQTSISDTVDTLAASGASSISLTATGAAAITKGTNEDDYRIVFAGHATEYTISSPGTGTPTDVTISPALTADVAQGEACTIYQPYKEIEVVIGEGNLTYSRRQNVEYKLDKGRLDSTRLGDEVPLQVSFDFIWDYIKGRTEVTLSDALTKEGMALAQAGDGDTAGWLSVDTDQCEPYAVDLVLVYEPTPSTCGDMETIVFGEFRWEQLDCDLRAGTVSCSGQCNVTKPTITRAAQT